MLIASSPYTYEHLPSDTIQPLSRESSHQHSAPPKPDSSTCEMTIVFTSVRCDYFVHRVPSLRLPSLFCRPPKTTAMAKTEITGDKLNARTKVNGEQRYTHRDKDCLRDRNEHGFKFKHAQDAALDRY